MPDREVWDVVPHPEGWAVQHEGTSRADSVHETKDGATDRGVELAKAAGGQLRIKGRDGRVQDERTYGDDPTPAARLRFQFGAARDCRGIPVEGPGRRTSALLHVPTGLSRLQVHVRVSEPVRRRPRRESPVA